MSKEDHTKSLEFQQIFGGSGPRAGVLQKNRPIFSFAKRTKPAETAPATASAGS